MKIIKLFGFSVLVILFSSCGKEDVKMQKEFTVTIENTFSPKDYFVNGTTGLIKPGESETFSFNAGKGHYLQFGTMFVQSNDLFIAPSDEGIDLYPGGNALTGDITDRLMLWDAGTEVNEEPGTGANQPPRQSGPNTGVDENGTVHVVNDGFSYPALSDVIKVTVSHDGGTGFSVTIENISGGASVPTPFAPGTWVVHGAGQKPMFQDDNKASPGLEALAEDGDVTKMNNNLTSKSGFFSPFAPGAYSFGTTNDIFMVGSSADAALEALAEDGDPSGFDHVFNTPSGGSGAGPLLPGSKYSFSFTAEEGSNFSFAMMLVQSNDWFVGIDAVSLFSGGSALSGDITGMVKLYDAGTEKDEYAGAGNNQPLRQSGPNTGANENGNVVVENSPGAHVPSVSDYLKVTISTK